MESGTRAGTGGLRIEPNDGLAGGAHFACRAVRCGNDVGIQAAEGGDTRAPLSGAGRIVAVYSERPASRAARACSRGCIRSRCGLGRRLTARGSIRSGRLPTWCVAMSCS